MKNKLEAIPGLWKKLEFSVDQLQDSKRKESIVAFGDAAAFRCIAECTPEFAGKVAAYLLTTFSDTPANSDRMRRAMMVGLNKAAVQK